MNNTQRRRKRLKNNETETAIHTKTIYYDIFVCSIEIIRKHDDFAFAFFHKHARVSTMKRCKNFAENPILLLLLSDRGYFFFYYFTSFCVYVCVFSLIFCPVLICQIASGVRFEQTIPKDPHSHIYLYFPTLANSFDRS